MRNGFWVAVVLTGGIALAACSSNNGNSGTLTTCKNPPATGGSGTECVSCSQSQCGSQTSAAVSACPALFSCIQQCDCSDQTCLNNCSSNSSNIPTTCLEAAIELDNCQASSCASQCGIVVTTTDAGPG